MVAQLAGSELELQIPGVRQSRLAGLLGDANGDQGNDLTTSDARQLAAGEPADAEYRRVVNRGFAPSWRVPGASSLLP
jgi:hypothetical protein